MCIIIAAKGHLQIFSSFAFANGPHSVSSSCFFRCVLDEFSLQEKDLVSALDAARRARKELEDGEHKERLALVST